MGVEKNQELLRYYKERRVWLLEADDVPPKLQPYSGTMVTASGREDPGPGRQAKASRTSTTSTKK
jgi:hypothetical protein